MCNGIASTSTKVTPINGHATVLPCDETHWQLSPQFTACGRRGMPNVTADRRLVTCHSCHLQMIDDVRAAA